MASRVAIIGANGQLGTDLRRALSHVDLVPLTHQDVEVTDRCNLEHVLGEIGPEVVVNTAAFHKLELCEADPWRAFDVNALGAYHVARVARKFSAKTVFISTDYVFDGESRTPYDERSQPHPLNVYGASKLAGEQLVLEVDPSNLVVRTSGLYGTAGASGKGGNFVELMRRLGRERGEVTVVTDQVLGPTYTADLAVAVSQLIERDASGVAHVTNRGACSWYEFATAIFELSGMDVEVHPTTTEAFGSSVRRPSYSVLANETLAGLGVPALRPWREALQAYLQERPSS